MWKGVADGKKAKRPSKEKIKKQLLELMITDEVVDFKDINKEAKEMREPEKAAEVIKRYEGIIKMKIRNYKRCLLSRKVFKRFKEKEKLVKLVSELAIHKTIIIFKINALNCLKNTLNY